MQKKQNPRKPKYYSFTVTRDSFVDQRKLDTIDTPLLAVSRRNLSDTDDYPIGFPYRRKGPLDIKINRMAKRSLDIILSSLVIVSLLSWLVPILILLIKLRSKGPAFILEKRKKKHGQLFTCISFSTRFPGRRMSIHSTGKINHRINPFSRFLINHHLDELPQFINVFLGDMSIIGPLSYNEQDASLNEQLFSGYHRRYAAKPGLLGLYPITRYPESSGNIQKMKARTRLDLFYINHWSVGLDCKILLQSLQKMAGFALNYSQNDLRKSS
jgi:putative colanic acid biosynthesis UDP-glucose lipid carrier transferase